LNTGRYGREQKKNQSRILAFRKDDHDPAVECIIIIIIIITLVRRSSAARSLLIDDARSLHVQFISIYFRRHSFERSPLEDKWSFSQRVVKTTRPPVKNDFHRFVRVDRVRIFERISVCTFVSV